MRKLKLFVLPLVVLMVSTVLGMGSRTPAQASNPKPRPAPRLPGAGLRRLPKKFYGVTVDSVDRSAQIVESLGNLAKTPVVRIVFDENIPARDYAEATDSIARVGFVMGEILDSYYVTQYSPARYKARVKDYLETLGSSVDLWEVGNEVNGEWLGKTADVVAKISDAYDQVKARGYRAELTLYYNKGCWEKPSHEMFRWAQENIPERMKQGLDYVFVSYYEDDCNGLQPNWQEVANKLGALFPNSAIGIGEAGTKAQSKKIEFINRYYSLKVDHPRWVGGVFWWYFHQDMVPMTKPLWSILNGVIGTR